MSQASETRIPVSIETREDLKDRGRKGDTYDNIIRRLLQGDTNNDD